MKTGDLNRFKDAVRNALREWGAAKIDELLPTKAAPKVFIKNGLNNLLARYGAEVDKWIDGVFLFVADENGVIDSGTMVDTLADIFKEMPGKEYTFGAFTAVVGDGEAIISFPHNFLTDLLVGDMGSVKFTTEDILEIKELIV